ncbi:hypothetical protein DE146DRAFT_746777 [Phaeosphaeria sp. MPI-PUGE-AT-0046c]|nr:hypothetical protein DE146DRAFT_746777 [Phaeosphaeria sp. MPI-PUGE-AT-0046c]
MPGKRKRTGDVATSLRAITPAATNERPRSAIAASRLKAEAAAQGVVSPEATTEPVQPPSDVLPPSPAYGHEESESEEGEEPLIIKQNLKLCSWRNESQHVLLDTDTDLAVKINKHITISLVGHFRFKVLKGAVNINGANIGALSREGRKDQEYTAYVPATHPITKIRGLDSINQVHFTHCTHARPLAHLGTLFRDIWNSPVDSDRYPSFRLVTESDADALARPLRPETSPEDWLRAVEECAVDPSIVVAVGASATGKSTFLRRLLNRYLTGQGKSTRALPAVCYLDLDPTQPEYTPHGQISLCIIRSLNLGPNFTHSVTSPSRSERSGNEMVRSHSLPTNFANYRDYYQACVEDLFQAYRCIQAQTPDLTLIVNTSGSLYVSDFDLLVNILGRFKPFHTVHLCNTQVIDTDSAAKLHTLQTTVSRFRGTMHEITAQHEPSVPMRTKAELGAMQMQSHFHSNVVKASGPDRNAWVSEPLSSFVPWEVCYDETSLRKQDFVGFALYTEPFEPASLLHALNGTIVQIVDSTSSAIPTPYTSLTRTPKHRIPYFERSVRTGMVEPLDPRTSKLVCTALVRGFDPEKNIFQLVVPKAYEEALYGLLPERTVLVGGCCDAPEWAYREDVEMTDREGEGKMESDRATKDVPWVERKDFVEDMGYLNTVRRVRKFQT